MCLKLDGGLDESLLITWPPWGWSNPVVPGWGNCAHSSMAVSQGNYTPSSMTDLTRADQALECQDGEDMPTLP